MSVVFPDTWERVPVGLGLTKVYRRLDTNVFVATAPARRGWYVVYRAADDTHNVVRHVALAEIPACAATALAADRPDFGHDFIDELTRWHTARMGLPSNVA